MSALLMPLIPAHTAATGHSPLQASCVTSYGHPRHTIQRLALVSSDSEGASEMTRGARGFNFRITTLCHDRSPLRVRGSGGSGSLANPPAVVRLVRGGEGGQGGDVCGEKSSLSTGSSSSSLLLGVCLELRSSLEYVTKFLPRSHNRSVLPDSLAAGPRIRASPPAHPAEPFMFPNHSLSTAPGP
ncbi:unnamed protein product [Arctogadus glacialis]